MKQNVSETESNWHFQKNIKTSAKQEIVSNAAFNAWKGFPKVLRTWGVSSKLDGGGAWGDLIVGGAWGDLKWC